MPMLVTCVCSTCSKVTITVVNSHMISNKQFYPDRWNILYSDENGKSQAVPICSQNCMQLHANRTNSSNVWVEPDGSEQQIKPVEIH